MTLTSTEQNLVKYLNMKTNEEPVEVVKQPGNTLVVEYPHYMYILEDEAIISIYTLEDGDWICTYRGKESLANVINTYSVAYTATDINRGKYVVIEKLDGSQSHTIYYHESFWDNKSNTMIYLSGEGRELIGIGDDYAFYEDSIERTVFKIVK